MKVYITDDVSTMLLESDMSRADLYDFFSRKGYEVLSDNEPSMTVKLVKACWCRNNADNHQ